jgi:ADP-ribose pyrophosphatase YjhB (NUDIX family)
MKNTISCSKCGNTVSVYRNPIPTADVIIRVDKGIVLIKRKNPPHGWALPGGFIDYGESAEHAAVREAAEETSLQVKDLTLFRVYSDPERDPRHHTLTVVFTARGVGKPAASDDADDLGVFWKENLPQPLAFDHSDILDDYFKSIEDSHSK